MRDYVSELLAGLRVGAGRRRRIAAEVSAHLAELIEEERRRGAGPEEAAERARVRFGDPHALAAEFNADAARHSLNRAGWALAGCVTVAFAAAGMPHIHLAGQKGMHGVAIASKLPIEKLATPPLCMHSHARCAAVGVAGYELHNLYVPAGADIPDPMVNDKFAHKLDFIEKMRSVYAARARRKSVPPLLVVGDINIAPEEHDVWSHKQLLDVVSHTPVETEAFRGLEASLGFIDLTREATPEPEKLASWWSYRAADFRQSNRGLRLDHILVSPGLKEAAYAGGKPASRVLDHVREWERPSDHAPVIADFAVA